MKTVNGAAITTIASGKVALAQLVYMGFSPTPLLLNTSTMDLTWNSQVFKGAAGLGTVDDITDGPGEIKGLRFQIVTGDSSTLALALDDANTIQGVLCQIRTALVNTTTYTIDDAPLEWEGFLDTMSISEDANTATVTVTSESRAYGLLRGSPWMYTDTEQTAVRSTDRSFQYVNDQMDKPIVWPDREFFKQS